MLLEFKHAGAAHPAAAASRALPPGAALVGRRLLSLCAVVQSSQLAPALGMNLGAG